MSSIPVQLVRYGTKDLAEAVLHLELTPAKLAAVEKDWGPVRREAIRRLAKSGRPNEQIPRHFHWDWETKSANLELLACRCFGIECERKMQGLIMLLTASKVARLQPDAGKPLVYVDYLESAPWNVKALTDPPQYTGVGMVLMRAAVQLSIDEGFHGRLGLHALPLVEDFYRNKCGMQFCGNDKSYENLPYYEMTRAIAVSFQAH